MGFEPVANLLSPVGSVGLTPFRCRFWAYETGILRPSCAQIFRITRGEKGTNGCSRAKGKSIGSVEIPVQSVNFARDI